MIFRRLRHAMVFCFFPSEPPESVKSKGTRGQRDALILEKQNHPHVFALGLKDAACKAPVLAPLLDRTRAPPSLQPRSGTTTAQSEQPPPPPHIAGAGLFHSLCLRRLGWLHGLLGSQGRPREIRQRQWRRHGPLGLATVVVRILLNLPHYRPRRLPLLPGVCWRLLLRRAARVPR